MATHVSAAGPRHGLTTRLEDQAATAALYVTKHRRNKSSEGNQFLDRENKLSSAGAAASLKYASPEDLPSFPSSGLRKNDSAAEAAASLGWANQKTFEHWKPNPSPSASKAAMLAKDYKAPPIWQAEQSASGAKAAVLAAKDGGKVEIWKPETSAWGNSAANQAFKSDRSGALSPKVDHGYTSLGRQGSLMAATGAMLGTRKRSDSTPVFKASYPDEANATTNALSAATHANNPSRRPRTEYTAEGGASPLTTMPKEMFTSHPPVASEVDEKKRNDSLHASAVAMAKQMYKVQQSQIDQAMKVQRSEGQSAAMSAHGKLQTSSTRNDETQPMRFTSLQEAAQKLAQERLAKLHDEHAQNREYRNYYGDNSRQTSKLSIRGRARRRASSDGSLDEDREQSQKIRAQMSLFSSNISQIDAKKRQKDREALMAVAQRNVTARLSGMDERVFKDTGKVAPSMLNEWEVKAHAAAQKNSDNRMQNYGKVNIGGGKFIDQSDVDVVAARNVQPVLDEINEKVEKERVRQAELKLEQEASKRSAEAAKVREKEVKEINRKLKEQDKEEERARKGEEKARKEEEKSTKADQKRSEKLDKRKSKEIPVPQKGVAEEMDVSPNDTGEADGEVSPSGPNDIHEAVVPGESSHATETVLPRAGYTAPDAPRTSMEIQSNERLDDIAKEGQKSPTSPAAPKSIKVWLKNKFARRQSKSQRPDPVIAGNDETLAEETILGDESRYSATDNDAPVDTPATEGVTGEAAVAEVIEADNLSVSSVSSMSPIDENIELGNHDSRDDEFEEARDHFDEELAPPTTSVAPKSTSPVRDSRFHEVL